MRIFNVIIHILEKTKKLFPNFNFTLFFLLSSALLIRYLYIKDGVLPFSFDHGKDSLAVMDLVLNLKLKFIGPWTSISGLYFGPLWYYLLAPFYLAFGMDPVAGAYAMIFLGLLQIYLLYRYFGFTPAFIFTFGSYWISLSKSAWNPFPMSLLSILIAILLKKQIELRLAQLLKKKSNFFELDNKLIFGLFFVASLGFHFSTAYAIFYPICIVLTLAYFKFWPSLKNLLTASIGFVIPFVPQLLFELKNNFMQTRAVITYLQTGGTSEPFSLHKLYNVFHTAVFEIIQGVSFNLRFFSSKGYFLIALFIILYLSYIFYKNIKQTKLIYNFTIALIFTLIPLLGFSLLHFNVWYLLAIVPFWLIFFSQIYDLMPKIVRFSFYILFLISAFLSYREFKYEEIDIQKYNPEFLNVKKEIISYIRTETMDQDFKVFVYVPYVYDYAYQYLFFVDALNGKKLPIEFSHQSGEHSYVVEKERILNYFGENLDTYLSKAQSSQNISVFLISTQGEHNKLKEHWFDRQKNEHGEVVKEKMFGDKIVVYKLEKKN